MPYRRAQGGAGGGGPMGPMGGPMEFGRSKSKFQEVPETGVTFVDVAVSSPRHSVFACTGLGSAACMAGCTVAIHLGLLMLTCCLQSIA